MNEESRHLGKENNPACAYFLLALPASGDTFFDQLQLIRQVTCSQLFTPELVSAQESWTNLGLPDSGHFTQIFVCIR